MKVVVSLISQVPSPDRTTGIMTSRSADASECAPV